MEAEGAFSRGRPCVFLSSTYWMRHFMRVKQRDPILPPSPAAQEESKEERAQGCCRPAAPGPRDTGAHSPFDSPEPSGAQKPVSAFMAVL